jgi:phosphoribosylformylglycinamidine synthase subunit PurL
MVGLIPDLTKICGQGWQTVGDVIYLLGLPLASTISLGASEYLATIHGTIAGKPPRVDFDLERRVQKICREGISAGWIHSAHDCAEGGVAIALAECCIAGNLGAEINLEIPAALPRRLDEVLFGEGGARILVSVSSEQQESWESYLQEHLGQDWQKLGKVGDSDTDLAVLTTDNHTLIKVTIKDLSDRFYNAISKRLAIHTTTPQS